MIYDIWQIFSRLLTILLIARKALEVSVTHVTVGDNSKAVPLKLMLKRPCGQLVRL